MKSTPLVVLAGALALGGCNKHDDIDTTTQTTGATITAVDQSNARADIDVTANIRKMLVSDSDLSMNAKNVKIITRQGNVTLRGVVNTDAEKAKVQDEASRIAGVRNVDNEIDVK
jgi:osmotically-inducible protein OsmY